MKWLSLEAVASVAYKEFLHIYRDRRVLLLVLTLPPLFTLLFGHAFETGELTGVPSLLIDQDNTPRAQEFIRQSVRAVQGSHYTMHFQSDDPLQGMIFLDALRRGEIVAMQGDRPRTGSRTVDASLFGLPIALPSGPAALARTAEVPMLPVFAIREGRRRCRVIFCPPVHVPRTDDRNADFTWAMGRVAAEVERAVRGAPHQWFVFRELWPETGPVSR